jgi:hypothetical protein
MTRWLSLLLLLLIFLMPRAGRAQEFGHGGVYALVEAQATRVNEGFGAVFGLHGGWETLSGCLLGGVFYDLLNGTQIPDRDGQPPLHTKMHYGGALVGKTWAFGPVRAGFSLVLGAGDVSKYGAEKNRDFDRSVYLFTEPALIFRLPDLAHFRWQLSAGYRLPVGIKDRGTDTNALHGPSISLAIGVAQFWGPGRYRVRQP